MTRSHRVAHMPRQIWRQTLPLSLFLLTFIVSTLYMNAFHPAPRVAAQTKIAGINGATCAYTTIGAAIAAAQKGDTIYIEPGEYTELLGEINLSLLFVPARARDSCRVEDTGANSATVIINGGDGSADSIGGLVKITGGAQVTFRHMTLKNASASNGGVVAVTTGGDLILDDANVTDGTASSSGGNIYALTSSGDLSTVRLINGSNVYRGTASLGDGGAIALFGGALTIDSGGIGVSSNNGFSTAANNGGGIYADGATINLNSAAARVIWNQAGNDGGGIYALNTRVNLTNAIVENNEAGASGGGIYLTRTSGDTDLLMATGASISHNEALVSGINQGGGGLYLIGAIEGELSNTTVEGNISRTGGGGLYMRTNVDLLLSNGTQIVSNQSGGAGGGVSMAQAATTLTLDNSSIADNVSGTIGGGIYSAFGSIFLRNNAVISGNQSENGGGIHVVGSSSGSSNTQIHAENSMISLNKALSNNSTVGNGGGINAVDTRIVMTDTLFTANEAQRRGGGLYLSDADSELRMTGGGFSGNRTITVGSNQGGGAVYALNNLEMFLEDVMIVGNETINSGGGFHLRQGPKLYMQGGWLGLNSANSTGGAIYAAQSTTRIVMADTLVSENSVNTAGGAFYFTFARGQFHNVTLRENTANRGGGAYFWFTEIDLFNSHVHSNSAGLEGGGIYLNGATLNLRSVLGPDCEPFALPADEYCTEVRGNRAGEYGGGLYLLGSSSTSFEGRLEAEHLAIVDNLAPLGGTAIFADGTHTPAVTLINVLVAGNGDNNDDSTAIELNGAGALQLHSVTLAGNFDNPLWMLDASAQFSLTNSIIYENLDGPRVAFQIENTLRCNLSQSPASNGRNLGTNVNPQFTTTARGAYRLGSTSPALDACNKSGLHATADISGPARDADFGFRPVGTRFDQGAFERGSTTEVFELSVSGPSGTGSGRFTSSPAGIDCPDTCSAAFPGGATVTLSATPATGSTFDGWGSAACPGTGTCELLMDGDKSVAPSFTLNSYSLTVSTNGNGNVTSNPASIICGSGGVDCSATYDHGTAVTLSADPDGGAEFAGWSGACTGMDSCVVLMNGPRSVSAGFAQINVSHTATVMVVGTGTVTSSRQGINCGSGGTACSATYPENSGVELTATPDPGQDFAGWSGDCADAGACQLLLDADKTVTATFEASLVFC